MEEILEGFRCLFQGRKDVWGSIQGKCNKEPITDSHYEKHLKGELSLGIYPLLDDGTCYFFAIDLDENNFEKAKRIRQELINGFIPAYIAKSKSKGYHIYGFALEKFVAKEIRHVLSHILNKLNIKAEIFPKQDMVNEVIPYGNYINLPCFGDTRPFLSIDNRKVPLSIVLERFKRVPQEALLRILKTIPEEKPLIPKKVKGKQKKHPPCIEAILRGVVSPGRDEAAFALARHYLDCKYLPEEVLGLLKTWDLRNSPPLSDDRLLEVKVRSAQKGYGFGCSSIVDNPMLAGFCSGEDSCEWLKEITELRKKKGLIRELSFYENEHLIYEEIIQGKQPMFAIYDKNSGEITYTQKIEVEDYSIVPVYTPEITEGAVTMPSGVEEYGSTLDLIASIKEHILEYVDIPAGFLEFTAWYIIMSWIHDKLMTVGYLRFAGDTGCGKSRSLDVIGKLCYKPMMLSGAITPAPIYRIIRRFRGTLILDEADFRDSTEKSEVVTLLNCGFERNRPVIRCSKDDPNNLEILPCFGPKVFATRFRFQDVALEARCLTHTMEETDRNNIPYLLGETFDKRTESLRNKLLLWRLRNLDKIDAKAVEHIDLGNIEPRLKQTSLPYAVPFKDMPDVMERFKAFIFEYNKDLIRERSEGDAGKIVYSIFQIAQKEGKGYISGSTISSHLSSELSLELSASKIGRILKSLNIKRIRKSGGNQRARYIVWEPRLMRKLLRRYVTEPEDFAELFAADGIDINASIDMEV